MGGGVDTSTRFSDANCAAWASKSITPRALLAVEVAAVLLLLMLLLVDEPEDDDDKAGAAAEAEAATTAATVAATPLLVVLFLGTASAAAKPVRCASSAMLEAVLLALLLMLPLLAPVPLLLLVPLLLSLDSEVLSAFLLPLIFLFCASAAAAFRAALLARSRSAPAEGAFSRLPLLLVLPPLLLLLPLEAALVLEVEEDEGAPPFCGLWIL
jgi:hypothetical protein